MKSKRRSTVCRHSALIGSGTLLALAVAQILVTSPAQARLLTDRPAPATGWRVSASVSVKGELTILTQLSADSASDAWATGISVGHAKNHPVIEHWTGKAWRRVRLSDSLLKGFDQGTNFLATIGAASAHDVWIFSGKRQYLRLKGSHWTKGRLPSQPSGDLVPQSVQVFGPNDVWVLGCEVRSGKSARACHAQAARFNGRSWRFFRLPGVGGLAAVSALSANDIWTIDRTRGARSQAIVHWNGTTWRRMPVEPALPAGADLSAIAAISDSDIWVGGSGPNSKHGSYELLRHWNGRAWVADNPAVKLTSRQRFVEDLVSDGTGGIWDLASSGNYDDSPLLRHFSHGRWQAPVKVDWILISLAPIPGTASTWGVGTSENVNRGLIVLHGPKPH
ncbi:MAG TPA: hypothetical protein VFI65_02375 [Streptosporangiaceae bacterium]|nr:hypothetical protein [Streptosporangiaceae bacterium]